jgi:hypothetical protein
MKVDLNQVVDPMMNIEMLLEGNTPDDHPGFLQMKLNTFLPPSFKFMQDSSFDL